MNYAPAFGVSEISQSYIPIFLDLILDENGYIPIHIVVGGSKAMDIALKEQNELRQLMGLKQK